MVWGRRRQVDSRASRKRPQHIHNAEDEAFYVLEGEVNVLRGEETLKAAAGAFVLIPRGTVHTFANPLSTPSKFLIIASPSGFEHYFEELAPLIREHGYPPPEAMQGLAEKYKFQIVPPASS